MRIPDKNTLLEQGRDYLSCSLDLLATLPSLPLSELVAGRTALILVDLVEGFAREGALASPRVEALLPRRRCPDGRCAAAGMEIVVLADCHTPDSLELGSYPSHCLRGTSEARLAGRSRRPPARIPSLRKIPPTACSNPPSIPGGEARRGSIPTSWPAIAPTSASSSLPLPPRRGTTRATSPCGSSSPFPWWTPSTRTAIPPICSACFH